MMQKLGRFYPTAIAILLVATLLGIVYMGIAYADALGRKSNLELELRDLEHGLAEINDWDGPYPDDPTGESGNFPTEVCAIELMDLVFEAAAESGLRVTAIGTMAVGHEQLGHSVYRTARVAAHLRGHPVEIEGFLRHVESRAISTIPTIIVDGFEVVQHGEKWDVWLDVIAYALGE